MGLSPCRGASTRVAVITGTGPTPDARRVRSFGMCTFFRVPRAQVGLRPKWDPGSTGPGSKWDVDPSGPQSQVGLGGGVCGDPVPWVRGGSSQSTHTTDKV